MIGFQRAGLNLGRRLCWIGRCENKGDLRGEVKLSELSQSVLVGGRLRVNSGGRMSGEQTVLNPSVGPLVKKCLFQLQNSWSFCIVWAVRFIMRAYFGTRQMTQALEQSLNCQI